MQKISRKLQKATAWLLAIGMTLSAIQPTIVYADTETSAPTVEVTSDADSGSSGFASIDIQANEEDSSILDVKTSNTKDSDQEMRLHLWEFDEGFFEDYEFTKTPEKNVTIKDLSDTKTTEVTTKSGETVAIEYIIDEDNNDYYISFTAEAQTEYEFSINFENTQAAAESTNFVVEPEIVNSTSDTDRISHPVELIIGSESNVGSESIDSDENIQTKIQADDNGTENSTNKTEKDTNKSKSLGGGLKNAPSVQNLTVPGEPVQVVYDGLTVTAETSTSQNRKPAIDENGALRYYTGETATTTISVSNPSGSGIANGNIHIYMQSNDPNYRINMPIGTSNVTVGDNIYQINVTDGYCIEIPVPFAGDTISINIGSSFASGITGGGTAVISAEIITADGTSVKSDNVDNIIWDTNPNPYPVTKSLRDTWHITGSGLGDGIAYLNGLSYSIITARSGETLEGIGEDPLSKITYSDTIILPEGWSFTDKVHDAFSTGNITYNGNSILYGENILYTITTNNEISITTANLSEDQKELTITWDCKKANDYQFVTTFGDYTINADLKVNAGDSYEITNKIIATEYYTYTEEQVQNDSVTSTLTAAESGIDLDLKLDVETASDNTYTNLAPVMGADAPFIITLTNTGVTTMEVGNLIENIPRQFYITPEGIEQMFASSTGDVLELTITNATIANDDNTIEVTGIDGGSHYTTIDDTWSKTEYDGVMQPNPDSYVNDYTLSNGASITFKHGNNCIIMTFNSNNYVIGENGYYKTVAEALEAICFKNSYYTQYSAIWNFDEGDETIYGGEIITIEIPTVAKSSFMLLTKDSVGWYNSNVDYANSIALPQNNNVVQLRKADGVDIYKTTAVNNIYTYMDYGVYIQSLHDEQNSEEGSITEYENEIRIREGAITYSDEIPIVNQFYGSQVLMVPYNENQSAVWADEAEIYTDETTSQKYLLLTEEGEYDNVYIGEVRDDPYNGQLENNVLIADKILIEDTEQGLCTTVYWYLEKFELLSYTSSPNDYAAGGATIMFTYNVLNTAKYSNSTYKYLSNTAYVGDYQGHRLVDSFGGTSFNIKKDIVKTVGDVETESKNSAIGEGDSVTYRLMLYSTTDHISKVTGSEMSDILPLSLPSARWTKSNVKISYSNFENVSDESENAWDITEASGSTNQQNIKWADDFSLTFNSPAYIWVTLTYPDSTDWDSYIDAYGSTLLTNTFKVDGPTNLQESVNHNLKQNTEVLLQKGVYATGSMSEFKDYQWKCVPSNDVESRIFYQNGSYVDGYVAYYVVLYNDGDSNLYLNDMTDVLPEGFEYSGLATSRTDSNVNLGGYSTAVSILNPSMYTVTTSNREELIFADIIDQNHSDVSYKSTLVTAKYNDNDGTVTFSFPKATPGYHTDISYNDNLGMAYLKPGEAIEFAYACYTPAVIDDYSNEKLNSIAMPIYNISEGDVAAGDSKAIVFDTGVNANDGDCNIIGNEEAMSNGFTSKADDIQWVTSSVNVYKGEVKPGISKVLSSSTSETGIVNNNPVTVTPSDILSWDATITNDGTNTLSDYTITDELPYPYAFEGDLSYTIYGPTGYELKKLDNFFTITDNEINEQNKVQSITISYTESDDKYQITDKQLTIYEGTESDIINITTEDYNDISIKISLKYNNDNLCLGIRFIDNIDYDKFFYSHCGIPSGGYGILSYSTRNYPNIITNKTYQNNAYVTPMTQKWNGDTNIGNYVDGVPVDELASMPSVRNSAPFTVTSGWATTASKSIAEKNNTLNTASSTSDRNFIVIDDASKEFTYNLMVDNVSNRSMDKLILIDNLPEVNDHNTFDSESNRESSFAVSLSDIPSFTVTVTPDNANASWSEYTLTADQYTIQYSNKTDFTAEDWNGSGEGWATYTDGDNLSNVRSIRLIILDDSGSLIPANASVHFSFSAKADANAQSGEYAWNSFGYHYSMVNSETELEAAPLKVGVAITGKPIISKSTVDADGNPATLKEDETYRYILYKGHYMTGIDGTSSVDDVVAALKDEGTEFSYIELNVPAGETVSDQLSLADIYAYDYNNADGFTATDTPWTWENDASYTLWEIPSENYTFDNVNGGETINNAFTFTYTNTRNQTLECVNELIPTTFDIRVNKYYSEEVGGTTYTGAVEGAVLQVWNADKSEMIDEQTVDETGYVTFTELEVGDYVLVEAKAPDHFMTASDIAFTVNKDGTITTENSDNIGTDDNGMYLKMKDEMEDGTITIQKYADDEKSPLAGVTYTLYDSADQVVDTKVTGEDGKVIFTDIPFGDYTIVETQTADGYSLLAEPISVTIPLVMTAEEAHANDADTTQAFYDKDTDSYIFFDLTYNVTDDATFVLPTTGSNNLAAMAMGGIGFMIILAGWLAYKRKKGYKGIINS